MRNTAKKNWIEQNIGYMNAVIFNRKHGTDAIVISGIPGSGKSNFVRGFNLQCLKRGEAIIMATGVFCEWKHFLTHPKYEIPTILILPDDEDFEYVRFNPKPKIVKLNYETELIDYITNLLKENNDSKIGFILAIYDDHFDMNKKIELWYYLSLKLINRPFFIDKPISIVFDEAGIYFYEYARGKQWRWIDKFSQIFVNARKSYIRYIFITQTITDIRHTIRRKAGWFFMKQGFATDNMPEFTIVSTPALPVNQYNVCYLYYYKCNNIIKKFHENDIEYRLIPLTSEDNQIFFKTKPKKIYPER